MQCICICIFIFLFFIISFLVFYYIYKSEENGGKKPKLCLSPSISPCRQRKISMQSTGNTESSLKILRRFFDFNEIYPQIKDGKCQLSNGPVYKFHKNSEMECKILSLFDEYTKEVRGVEISSSNLFHCHFILPTDNNENVILLFHAFEYPKDSGPLGYCQTNSHFSIHSPNYKKRNAIYQFGINQEKLQILSCPTDQGIYCTHYSEEFGKEVGEIICVNNSNNSNNSNNNYDSNSYNLELYFDLFK